MSHAALYLLGWLAAFGWCLRPIWGIDVFFHVAIGRTILDSGLPETDVYSAAHPDAAWVPFQAGYEVVVALLDRVGGLDLLRVFHAALIATALVLAWRLFRRLTGRRLAAFALTALLLLLFEERIRLRPHVLNLLVEVAVLVPLAAGLWRANRRRWLWIVALSALLWAALHAMAALWLVAVAGTILVAGPREDRLWGLMAAGLALVLVLLTPGALPGIAHVLSIQSQWATFVPELAPSWSWLDQGNLYGVVAALVPWLAALAVALAWSTRPPPERRATLLAAAGLAFGALWMVRLGYFSAFVFALVWPELGALGARLSERARTVSLSAVIVACVAALAVHVGPRLASTNPWTSTLQPRMFPVTEADLMAKAGIHGRIFNEAPWGGYLLYRLHPQSTVLSDGRVTFAPDVAELLVADNDPRARLQVAEAAYQRYGVDLLVRERGAIPESPRWRLVLRGPVADVWSRAGPAAQRRISALAEALGRKPLSP